MSYRIEVTTGTGWAGNALRFATASEAEEHARELSSRWLAVRDWRVVESPDPVNYRWVGRAEPLEGAA